MPKRARSQWPGGPAGKRFRRSFKARRYRKKLSKRINYVSRPFAVARWMKTGLPAGHVAVNAGTNYDSTTSILSGTGAAAGAETEMSCFFSLACLEYNEFSSLFDQYKIDKVLIQIKMISCPEAASTGAGRQFYPTLWWVSDMDDSNIQNIQELKEYAAVKHAVLRPNKEVNIMIPVKSNMSVYAGAGTTSTMVPLRNPWLDLAAPAVPHFGFKCAIDYEGQTLVAADNIFKYKVNVKFFCRFKGVR